TGSKYNLIKLDSSAQVRVRHWLYPRSLVCAIERGYQHAQHHPSPIKVAAFTGDANLTPGKNAEAAEGSQWQRPKLAKEHSGGGQRSVKQRRASISQAAAVLTELCR